MLPPSVDEGGKSLAGPEHRHNVRGYSPSRYAVPAIAPLPWGTKLLLPHRKGVDKGSPVYSANCREKVFSEPYRIFQGLGYTIGFLGDAAGTVLGGLGEAIGGATDVVGEVVDGIEDAAEDAWDEVTSWF